mmetsp:Transcript_3249/g.12388  ORF Transcript_3249/g.12388 Transcript_3249/m.12388 type:complete len:428 (+) Transcript_3249:92-1375(+)
MSQTTPSQSPLSSLFSSPQSCSSNDSTHGSSPSPVGGMRHHASPIMFTFPLSKKRKAINFENDKQRQKSRKSHGISSTSWRRMSDSVQHIHQPSEYRRNTQLLGSEKNASRKHRKTHESISRQRKHRIDEQELDYQLMSSANASRLTHSLLQYHKKLRVKEKQLRQREAHLESRETLLLEWHNRLELKERDVKLREDHCERYVNELNHTIVTEIGSMNHRDSGPKSNEVLHQFTSTNRSTHLSGASVSPPHRSLSSNASTRFQSSHTPASRVASDRSTNASTPLHFSHVELESFNTLSSPHRRVPRPTAAKSPPEFYKPHESATSGAPTRQYSVHCNATIPSLMRHKPAAHQSAHPSHNHLHRSVNHIDTLIHSHHHVCKISGHTNASEHSRFDYVADSEEEAYERTMNQSILRPTHVECSTCEDAV